MLNLIPFRRYFFAFALSIILSSTAWSVPKRTGAMQRDVQIDISIALAINHSDQLDHFLEDLYNPKSPIFGKYISTQEFAARYSPTLQQLRDVRTFLEKNHLQWVSVDANRLLVHAKGNVSSIEQAFGVQMDAFVDDRDYSTFYAPNNKAILPAMLPIVGIFGLDSRPVAKPHFVLRDDGMDDPKAPYFGLTPSDIRAAYQLPASYQGAGQTLGLFELDTFTQSDNVVYENLYGLPNVPVKSIFLPGAATHPGAGAVEVVLDIQLMIAVAPKVKQILVYQGPNTGAGVINTYSRIASDNLAKSVSTSWGAPETAHSGVDSLQAENNIFKQMAAQGQSMFAASGDYGAYDMGNTTLSVDDPAAQPYVTGVGGTKLNRSPSGSYVSETTWFTGKLGSGGGISQFWPIPSWQSATATQGSMVSTKMRNVPDVSLNADPATGYSIVMNGYRSVSGGTSAAAPIWAAFVGLVNEKRAAMHRPPLGFANAAIYRLAKGSHYSKLFHDIKDGSTNGVYPAVKKFDDATGWGSFIGSQLHFALANF